MNRLPAGARKQRGAISLMMALIVLVALSLLTLVGAQVALTGKRMAANDTRADAAFAAAEAGVQAAQAYLVANRSEVTSTAVHGWRNNASAVHWQACTDSDTSPPCGDGSSNLHGSAWQYFGPIPNLPTLSGEYRYQAWYLSRMLDIAPTPIPYTSCQQLYLLDAAGQIPILNMVGGLTSTLIGQVNQAIASLTNILNPVLGALVGTSSVLPANLAVPGSLCLPINFAELPAVPPPSRVNPTIYAVASAQSYVDTAGARAKVQVALQPTSLFAHGPIAAIMASGNADLEGDVRVWGNPRPPATNPDFSTINLNNLNPLGLDVSGLLQGTLNPLTSSLDPLVAPLLDPVLQDALQTGTKTVLDLTANVTFPLSIWTGGAVTLSPPACGSGNPSCTFDPSTSGGVLGGLLGGSFLGNLLNNLVGGLLGGQTINLNVLLQSARTCLPQWPGDESPPETGAARDACLPLSQTATVVTGQGKRTCILFICSNTWSNGPSGLSVDLKLPDVQDDTTTLQSIVAGLLRPGTQPTFPTDLFDYTFGATSDTVKAASTVSGGCGSFDGSTGGLQWVTGDCALTGTIGTPDAPVTIVTQGNLTLAPGTTVNGVVYLIGGGSKTLTGPQPGESRATILGGLMADGNASIEGDVNVVYDQANIRAAGFASGNFAPLPGSWDDEWVAQ